MIYKEYLTKLNGLEKRLGVFGEVHIYTPDESRFAREIMPNFDTVAVEGANQKSSLSWIGVLYIPMLLAYITGTNRSLGSDTSETLAEKYGKQVVRLEEDEEQLFPITQKIALATVGTISIPMSPFIYGYCKFYGDPYEVGTRAYEKRMAKKREGKKSLFSKFFEYAYKNNIEERNRVMVERSVEILREDSGNLLVVCGEDHLEGLVENLHDKLRLEETRSFP